MQDSGTFLRNSTLVAHRALEASAIARALMDPALTLANYYDILCIWAKVWKGMEAALNASAAREQCLGMLPAPRAHRVEQDLRALQQIAPVAQDHKSLQTASLPRLEIAQGAAELLGMCYVVQGATLGGKVIARHLQNTLSLPAGVGTTFFGAEDPSVPGWGAWLRALNERVHTSQDQQAALAGAERTFAYMHRAFSAAEVNVSAMQEAA